MTEWLMNESIYFSFRWGGVRQVILYFIPEWRFYSDEGKIEILRTNIQLPHPPGVIIPSLPH